MNDTFGAGADTWFEWGPVRSCCVDGGVDGDLLDADDLESKVGDGTGIGADVGVGVGVPAVGEGCRNTCVLISFKPSSPESESVIRRF